MAEPGHSPVAALRDTTGPVVLFPVRHHSPAAARLLRRLIRSARPAAVLIEGPADFNPRMEELRLDHELPIAIYSFVGTSDGDRSAAYYPFCEYSPEWVALRTAFEVGIRPEFIDVPWADLSRRASPPAHRYSDGALRWTEYTAELCARLQVADFDDLWDRFFEADLDLSLDDYMHRCHAFCYQSRQRGHVSDADAYREDYMAAAIRRRCDALGEVDAPVLVITGGFHSFGLWERLQRSVSTAPDPRAAPEIPAGEELQPEAEAEAITGIALTPYSYSRLDSLTGYEAGMPNPGFYEQVWAFEQDGDRTRPHRRMLATAVRALRRRAVAVSAADLIAAETMAEGLATLRGSQFEGRPLVWRGDLLDGIESAILKEAQSPSTFHPLIEAVHEALRGDRRGHLAKGVLRPPLVHDVEAQLARLDLTPGPQPREVTCDLRAADGRASSAVLHQLRILGSASFLRTSGPDLVARDDLSDYRETWRIVWEPTHDGRVIEAARYGATLVEATAARLRERATEDAPNAALAAELLVEATLAGTQSVQDALHGLLAERVRQDGSFVSTTTALDHLLHLYAFERVLPVDRREALTGLVSEVFQRAIWLLEPLRSPTGDGQAEIRGIRSLIRTLDADTETLDVDPEVCAEVLARFHADRTKAAVLRGAAMGGLWHLGRIEVDAAVATLRSTARPTDLGDMLVGVFQLAREAVQRHPEFVTALDALLVDLDPDEFLVALPALRLAFTFFTPREKANLAAELTRAGGGGEAGATVAHLAVRGSAESIAAALAFEARLFATLDHYHLGPTKP